MYKKTPSPALARDEDNPRVTTLIKPYIKEGFNSVGSIKP